MWTLLLKFWKPLAGGLIALWAVWFLHHRGYESGFAASEAKWQPRFDAAERELAAANAHTKKMEADSKALSELSQRRIDETLQTLHAHAVDSDSRLRSLSVRLAAASARRCEVPQASGATASVDAAARGNERAERAGARIAGTGEHCERDAARVAEWQRYYTEQRAILNTTAPPAGAESLRLQN